MGRTLGLLHARRRAFSSSVPHPPGTAPASRLAPPPADVGTSTDADLHLGLLRVDPIIQELARLIIHRKKVAGGLVRGALLTAASLCGSRPEAAGAVRTWLAEIVSVTSAEMSVARLEAEVARFLKRKPRQIRPAGIARLSHVTRKLVGKLVCLSLCRLAARRWSHGARSAWLRSCHASSRSTPPRPR